MKASAPKVVSVRKTVKVSKLPHGTYQGVWGGYVAKVTINGHDYELQTDIGIRTMAAPCTVTINERGISVVPE